MLELLKTKNKIRVFSTAVRRKLFASVKARRLLSPLPQTYWLTLFNLEHIGSGKYWASSALFELKGGLKTSLNERVGIKGDSEDNFVPGCAP
jgi:hypothetical protein